MAFVKNYFSINKEYTEQKNEIKGDKISIPLVVTKEKNDFHGFVPGIVMTDIIDKNLDTCKQRLIDYIKTVVKNMIKNKKSFPYFPDNETIKKDFDGVVLIKRIIVKVK